MLSFGFGFADSFRQSQKASRQVMTRMLSLYILSGGLLLMLWGRLVQLQVVEGKQYYNRSEGNRVEAIKVQAPRGDIVDRNGKFLTRDVVVEKKDELSEAGYQEIGREYVYGKQLAHVIGFMGEISMAELEGKQGYEAGDLIGKMGIEKQMERHLRGSKGGVVVETGVDGKMIRKLKEIAAVKGQTVKLTIDAGLQKKIMEVLGDRKAAVVVSEVGSNEILALVSSPSFDANVFRNQESGIRNQEERQKILEDENKPMFNRVLAGVYPPGSIFKIVTAVAGLEEGVIDEDFELEDTGEIKIGEFRYGNWYFDQYGRLDGTLDIVKAIARSNDIFFYKLGEMMGAQELAKWAQAFGLGKTVNLNLGKQAQGLVPSPEWKDRFMGERWFLGNTYHMAIGQGDLQVTPLQAHQMVSVLINQGQLCDLHLLKGDRQYCKDLDISKNTIGVVIEGMIKACSAGGTAFPFFDFEPQVACKTGTAQFNDPQDRTHAWMVVFGPAESSQARNQAGRPAQNDQILVTVLLEAAGEGSYEAGPVARAIFDYWFHERE